MESTSLEGARPRLTWVALVILTLVCVPTLVRATQSLRRDSASIRLNRGFNAPESKARVAPPAARVVDAAVVHAVPEPRAVLIAQPAAPPLLHSQHDVSPCVLRGPPLSLSIS